MSIHTFGVTSKTISLTLGQPAPVLARLSGRDGLNRVFEDALLRKTPDRLNLGPQAEGRQFTLLRMQGLRTHGARAQARPAGETWDDPYGQPDHPRGEGRGRGRWGRWCCRHARSLPFAAYAMAYR